MIRYIAHRFNLISAFFLLAGTACAAGTNVVLYRETFPAAKTFADSGWSYYAGAEAQDFSKSDCWGNAPGAGSLPAVNSHPATEASNWKGFAWYFRSSPYVLLTSEYTVREPVGSIAWSMALKDNQTEMHALVQVDVNGNGRDNSDPWFVSAQGFRHAPGWEQKNLDKQLPCVVDPAAGWRKLAFTAGSSIGGGRLPSGLGAFVPTLPKGDWVSFGVYAKGDPRGAIDTFELQSTPPTDAERKPEHVIVRLDDGPSAPEPEPGMPNVYNWQNVPPDTAPVIPMNENGDLTGGWRVLRDQAGTPAWVDLDVSRTAGYRAAHPYEPGLPLVLERTFTPSVTSTAQWMIIEVENHRLVEQAWLNGHPLKNLTERQRPVPSNAGTPGQPPLFAPISNASGNYLWWALTWEQPALLLVETKNLNKGENRLRIKSHDFDINGTLLGQVHLRPLQLADAIVVNSTTRARPEGGDVAVILNRRAAFTAPVQADIEIQDWFGAVIRRDRIELGNRSWFPIPQQDPRDYKAIVTVRSGEASLRPHWAYFDPMTVTRGTRHRLELQGWQCRAITNREVVSFPPPADGWQVGGKITGGVHRGYVRTTFTVPADWKGDWLGIQINRLDARGELYLNGRHVTRVDYTDCPATIDLSSQIKRDATNEMVIVLQDWSAFLTEGTPAPSDGESTPPRGTALCGFALWSVLNLEDVVLLGRPTVHISRTRLLPDTATHTLTVQTWITNSTATAFEGTLTHTAIDGDREALSLAATAVSVPAGAEVMAEQKAVWPTVQLWSPWSPKLYGLRSRISAGATVKDELHDRFGFRTFGIAKDQFILNGAPIHLMGSAGVLPVSRLDLACLADVFRDCREAGFNLRRIGPRFGGSSGSYRLAEVSDETGILINFVSCMDDMQGGFVAYTDPRLHANNARELMSQGRAGFNHPSIVFYDNGNEVYYQDEGSPRLAELMAQTEMEIRAFDPTRVAINNGSGDLNGLSAVNTYHYGGVGSAGGGLLRPTAYQYMATPADAQPADLKERALLKIKTWKRDKPWYNGEFVWIHHDQVPGDGMTWMGEEAMKFFSWWQECTFPLAQNIAQIRLAAMEFGGFRSVGLSGATLLGGAPNTHMNVEPIVAMPVESGTRFFANQPIERHLSLVNDGGAKAELHVTVNLTLARSTKTVYDERTTLDQGAWQTVAYTVPAMKVTDLTPVAMEVRCESAGRIQTVRRQNWTVYPRDWLGAVGKVRVALHDPKGSSAGLFEPFGVTPQALTVLAEVPTLDADLLVIGEDADPDALAAAGPDLCRWIEKGGTLLVLRQTKGLERVLPIDLKIHLSGGARKSQDRGNLTALLAPSHPLLEGLSHSDLQDWGPYGIVYGCSYDPPERGAVKMLAGLPPANTQLIEGRLGKGRWWATTLELTPTNMGREPAAARIVANALRLAATPTQPPARTLVLQGGGPAAGLLTDKLLLQAVVTNTPPATLADYDLLVLCGWQEQAPSETFAATAKAFAERGGTILAYRGGGLFSAWLQKATGKPVNYREQPAMRGVKVGSDPLLWGISDADMGWKQTDYHSRILSSVGNDDVMRDFSWIEGARALTYPPVLSVAQVGKGRMVCDASRWDARPKADALRWQSALLGNLGASLGYPKREFAAGRVVSGLTFHPVDLSSAANWSRTDTSRGDGQGWLDFGSDLGLPAGCSFCGGVLFDIADEAKTQGRSVVAVKAGDALRPSQPPGLVFQWPAFSKPIPVNAKADTVFFLHAAGYPLDTAPLAQYEIRYAGFSKLIPGQDQTAFVEIVPIRAGKDVGDWTSAAPPAIPGAQNMGGTRYAYAMQWTNPKPDTPIESIVMRSGEARGFVLLLGVTLGVKSPSLIPGDTATLPDYDLTCTKGKASVKGGRWDSAGWHGHFWSGEASGRVGLMSVPDDPGTRAFGMMTTDGRPSAMLIYEDAKQKLEPGLYILDFAYRMQTATRLAMEVAAGKADPAEALRIEYRDPLDGAYLPEAVGIWRTHLIRLRVTKPISLSLKFMNNAPGDDHAAYVRDITLTRAGE